MHLGRNVTYECLLSQTVVHQVLNASDGVFKRKSYWRKRPKKKDKNVLLQVKDLRKIAKFRAENILCTFASDVEHLLIV